jgi:hypothetical protein
MKRKLTEEEKAEKILDLFATYESTLFLIETMIDADRFTPEKKIIGVKNLISECKEIIIDIKKK